MRRLKRTPGVVEGESQACGSNCDPADQSSPKKRRIAVRRKVRFMPTFDHEFSSDASSPGAQTEGDHSRSEADDPGGDGAGEVSNKKRKGGKQIVTITEEKKWKSKDCCKTECCSVKIVESPSCFPGGGYICVVGCDGSSSGHSSNGLEFEEPIPCNDEAMCESETGENSDFGSSSTGPSMFSETEYLGELPRPPPPLKLTSSKINPVICLFTDDEIDLTEKTKSGLPRYRFLETVSMEATEDDVEKLEESATGVSYRIIRTSTEIGDIERPGSRSRTSTRPSKNSAKAVAGLQAGGYQDGGREGAHRSGNSRGTSGSPPCSQRGSEKSSTKEGAHNMVLRSDSIDLAFSDAPTCLEADIGGGSTGYVNIDSIDTPMVGMRSLKPSPNFSLANRSPMAEKRSVGSSMSSGSRRVVKSSYIDRKTGDVITMIRYDDSEPSPHISGTKVLASGEATAPGDKNSRAKLRRSSSADNVKPTAAFSKLFNATGGGIPGAGASPQVNAYGRIIRQDLVDPSKGPVVYNAFGRPIRHAASPGMKGARRAASLPDLGEDSRKSSMASLSGFMPKRLGGGPKIVSDGEVPKLLRKSSTLALSKQVIIESTARGRETIAGKNKQSRHQLVAELRLRPYTRWIETRIRFCELAEAMWFQYGIMVVIAANAITLALDDYPPRSKSSRDVISWMNFVFYLIFIVEAIALHIAYGPGMYWFKLGTGFDGCILIISTMELMMQGSGAFTAFRALRILKLAKQWKSFRMLMKSVMSTLAQIGNFVLLFLVVIYIFALLGQSFFATWYLFDPLDGTFLDKCAPVDQLNENIDFCYAKCHQHNPLHPGLPGTQHLPLSSQGAGSTDDDGTDIRNLNNCLSRANFDDFLWSCVTVFHILSGDAWHLVMYDGIKAKGVGMSLYFVVAISVGCFVVLNVFLAILISSFGEQQVQDKERSERKNFARNRSTAVVHDLDKVIELQNVSRFRRIVKLVAANAKKEKERAAKLQKTHSVPSAVPASTKAVRLPHESPVAPYGEVLTRADSDDAIGGGSVAVTTPASGISALGGLKRSASVMIDPANFSLFSELTSSRNNIKEKLSLIVLHPIFDRLILTCICISAVFIAIQNPLADPNTESYKLMNWGNLIFTILFTIEMVVKMYCFGMTKFPADNRHMIGPNIYQQGTGQKMFVKGHQDMIGSPENSEGQHNASPTKLSLGLGDPANLWEGVHEAGTYPSPATTLFSDVSELATSGAQKYLTFPLPPANNSAEPNNTASDLEKIDWMKPLTSTNNVVLRKASTFGNIREGFHYMNNPTPDDGSIGGLNSSQESMSTLNILMTKGKDAIANKGKNVAEGFFTTKTDQRVPYMKNPWNYLDMLVVLVSWVDEFTTRIEAATSSTQLSGFRILRLFRALRPLRLLSRNPSLRIIVDTILQVLPLLGNIVIITGIVFIVFSLWGMSNFKGAFYSCMNKNLEPYPYTVQHPSSTASALLIDPNGYHIMNYYGQDTGPSQNITIDLKTGIKAYPLINYRRSSPDTPVCVVHCRYGSDARFCKDTQIWGYNVVKCSHCLREFCPTFQKYFEDDYIAEAEPIIGDDTGDDIRRSLSRMIGSGESNEPNGVAFSSTSTTTRKTIRREETRSTTILSRIGLDHDGETPRSLEDEAAISNLVTLDAFYEETDDSNFKECYDNCSNDDYFCKHSRDNYDCMKQCISQCLCSDSCDGLVEDAANCVEQGGKWIKSYQNFDNIFEAATTLAEIATLQSFVDTMYMAIDARGPFKEPWRGTNEIWCLYFVLFVLVGSFFVMNLCVGMIIDNFNRVKKESGRGSLFLTESQESWVQCQKLLMSNSQFFLLINMQRVRNSQSRRKVFVFVSSASFDWAITSCIMLNTVIMCIKIIPEPVPYYNWWLEIISYVFLFVFNTEFFLKFYAMEDAYFQLGWNQFDFICVVASDVGLIIAHYAGGSSAALASILVLRVFRIARLFRLARFLKGLNKVFTAFVLSIPKLVNVGGLVTLLLFFYAIIGMYLFSKIRFFGNNVSVTVHNEFANFRSFWRSFITLFRSATGEGWNSLMHNFGADEFFYRSLLELDCETSMNVSGNYEYYKNKHLIANPIECGTRWSYFFFLSFMFVVSLVILNLFIAVIFEAFDESAQSDESFSEVAEMCLNSWQAYDPDYTCFLDLGNAMVYIERMILQLDIDQKFKEYAINMLERAPEDYDIKFAKSLYLRMVLTSSGKKKVPAVACVLSILRFRIIHGKATDATKSQDIIKELESLNEEYYSAGLTVMAKLQFEHDEENGDGSTNGGEAPRKGGMFGFGGKKRDKNMNDGTNTVLKADQPNKITSELIPLEQHIAATRLQRVLRQKLADLREVMDTPEYKEKVKQREREATEKNKAADGLFGSPLKSTNKSSFFRRSTTSV